MNPSPPASHQLVEHLFRHESGKMVAILTGIYGARNLQLAEDVVQEALVRALKTWPFGIPENPAAWLLRTAKNLAIDQDSATTDWSRILFLYDQLDGSFPSPVVTLNRAVAISKVHGADAAIIALEANGTILRLNSYQMLHAVLGDLESTRRNFRIAADHFRRAVELTGNKPERVLVAHRLEECASHEST